MSPLRVRLAVAATALLVAVPAAAAAGTPQVGGRAYLVENPTTGEILLQRNAHERLAMASITKLMTVMVALAHVRLDDEVTATQDAARVGESSIDLRAGERLTVRELVEAALIQSANDAAVALADYASGGDQQQFISWMNAKARALGLRDTHFVNPDGLDAPGHYSSASDLTRLALVVMRSPLVRSIVRRTGASISGGRRLHTWNDLLYTFPGVFGVKTGHTGGAGWSEVAAARNRQGVIIYATMLGEPTRAQRDADLTKLLAFGLSRYRLVPVVQLRRVYATAAVPWGKAPLGLVAARPVLALARLDRPLQERVEAARVVSLPVTRGDRLGEVRVYSRGRTLASVPLVASRSISRPGLLGRVAWYAGETVHHVWSWVS